MTPIKLMLVDDHEIVRVGLRSVFARLADVEIVGEAGTAASAVSEAARLNPDVVLMDVRLPDGSGVDACRDIRAVNHDIRVLFITSYDDEKATLSAILAGADGYVLKEINRDTLIHAVRSVASGKPILDPAATRALLENTQHQAGGTAKDDVESLSPREVEIVALVAEGKTNKEIAKALGLSPKTIKNYLSTVFQKLEAKSRAHAAALFTRHPTC